MTRDQLLLAHYDDSECKIFKIHLGLDLLSYQSLKKQY